MSIRWQRGSRVASLGALPPGPEMAALSARPWHGWQSVRQPLRLERGFWWAGEECAAVDDGVCDVDQFSVAAAGVGAKQFERGRIIDVVAFHQDALGALDQRAACECALQVLELGEAAKHDVERALQLFGVSVGDVGEDPALGRFVDEVAVVGLEDRDHWAGGGADDPVDQVERVLAALAEPD